MTTCCGIVSCIFSSVKVDALLSNNFPFREKKTDCCREIGSVGGSGKKKWCFFLLQEISGRKAPCARQHCHGGNNRWYARQRCDSFFTLFLIDTIKWSGRTIDSRISSTACVLIKSLVHISLLWSDCIYWTKKKDFKTEEIKAEGSNQSTELLHTTALTLHYFKWGFRLQLGKFWKVFVFS